MSVEEDIIGVAEQEYGKEYQAHVIELYKLYVEMADKISERRQAGNSFFLTLNSALVTVIGYINLSGNQPQVSVSYFWIIAIAGMVLCYLWYRLIHSYKDINTGKFKVIHAIEKKLPFRLYDAEWTALGKGKDSKLYLQFTDIEMIVPWIFFALHLTVVAISVIKFIR